MSDNVTNLMIVTGESHALDSFRERAKGVQHAYGGDDIEADAIVEPLSFHALDPVPEELLKMPHGRGGSDWEVKNWGVNLGTHSVEVELLSPTEIQYLFDTPWGAPNRFVRRISSQFPDLRFEMKWIAYAAKLMGIGVWQRGEIVEDWEREITEAEEKQVEMAWDDEISMFQVLRELDNA